MASDGAAIHHRSRPRLSPPQRGRGTQAGKGGSCSCSLSATVAVVAVAAAAAAVEYYEKHFYELQMKKENGVGWE